MREKLLALVEEKGDLPPLPEILTNLERKVNDPDCDVLEISAIIETEPVLSGRLIRLSNSVLFGGGREKAEDLNDAVMRLGVKMVLDMAYSLKLPGLFKPKGFNQLHFWTHSLGVAYLTRSLAYMVKVPQEEIEFAYLCGLMHDTGILVFDHLIPDKYSEFLKTIKSSDLTLAENEAGTFDITHAELGARFIEKWWPVSPGLVDAIRIHHDSPGESGNVKHIAHLLATANLLANQNEFSNSIVPEDTAPLEYGVLDKLDIDSEELEILIENTKEGLDAAQAILTTNG
ncbi:MAG: HDOD domain-containing protein [Nitrospina sp.]|jgi:HD-like signal output (HDOD) protein|nr:HDOD domain-containing protein [Nitrospina sp.]MBT3416135.1 HDOD domain-containing protein [Nitrospina sp.]MBT3858019.1 HDOD domain-containing protein [Nitrospina sp.]MBT4104249.1 HDOD domain-containing protein [Nitrospina sp.]MBT4390541.1 HDOD domain-containing protein [Nitrospina sp.]